METKERAQLVIFEDTLAEIIHEATHERFIMKQIMEKIQNSSITGKMLKKEFARQKVDWERKEETLCAEIKEVERREQILLDKVTEQEKEIEELKKRPAGDFETKEIHALNLKIKELENERKEGIKEHRRLRYIIDDLKIKPSEPHWINEPQIQFRIKEAIKTIRKEEIEPLENFLMACLAFSRINIASHRYLKADGEHKESEEDRLAREQNLAAKRNPPDLPGVYIFDGENFKALEKPKTGVTVAEGGKLGQDDGLTHRK